MALPRRRALSDPVWCIGALVIAVGVLWLTWRLPHQRDGFDLKIYRNAIIYWARGGDLYSFWQPHTARLGFTYPPFAAFVLHPLAMVPEHVALIGMTVLNLALCVAIGGCLGADLGRRLARPRVVCGLLGIALILGLEPIRQSLGFGQINIVLLALVLLDMRLVSTGRAGSGIAIGLAAAIKLTPAVLILALLVSGHRGAARRAVLAFLGASVLAAAADWGTSRRYWGQVIWQTDRVNLHPARDGNQSLTGVVARAEGLERPTSIWLVLAVASILIALWFAHRAAGWWADVRLLSVAATAATAASPVSWTHHFWWSVPAIATLIYFAARTRYWWAWATVLVAYSAFAIGPVTLSIWALPHGPQVHFIAADLYFLTSILVCGVLIFGRIPESSPAGPDPAGQGEPAGAQRRSG